MDIIFKDRGRKLGIEMKEVENATLLDLIKSWILVKKVKRAIDEAAEESEEEE